MPETPTGIVYPDSDGHTRLWEHFQTLAETVDPLIAGLPRIEYGSVGVPVSNSDRGSADVSFDNDYTVLPFAVATARIAAYNVGVTAKSTGGITVTVRYVVNASQTTTVWVDYIAIGM